jgi:hypothetical protein
MSEYPTPVLFVNTYACNCVIQVRLLAYLGREIECKTFSRVVINIWRITVRSTWSYSALFSLCTNSINLPGIRAHSGPPLPQSPRLAVALRACPAATCRLKRKKESRPIVEFCISYFFISILIIPRTSKSRL